MRPRHGCSQLICIFLVQIQGSPFSCGGFLYLIERTTKGHLSSFHTVMDNCTYMMVSHTYPFTRSPCKPICPRRAACPDHLQGVPWLSLLVDSIPLLTPAGRQNQLNTHGHALQVIATVCNSILIVAMVPGRSHSYIWACVTAFLPPYMGVF